MPTATVRSSSVSRASTPTRAAGRSRRRAPFARPAGAPAGRGGRRRGGRPLVLVAVRPRTPAPRRPVGPRRSPARARRTGPGRGHRPHPDHRAHPRCDARGPVPRRRTAHHRGPATELLRSRTRRRPGRRAARRSAGAGLRRPRPGTGGRRTAPPTGRRVRAGGGPRLRGHRAHRPRTRRTASRARRVDRGVPLPRPRETSPGPAAPHPAGVAHRWVHGAERRGRRRSWTPPPRSRSRPPWSPHSPASRRTSSPPNSRPPHFCPGPTADVLPAHARRPAPARCLPPHRPPGQRRHGHRLPRPVVHRPYGGAEDDARQAGHRPRLPHPLPAGGGRGPRHRPRPRRPGLRRRPARRNALAGHRVRARPAPRRRRHPRGPAPRSRPYARWAGCCARRWPSSTPRTSCTATSSPPTSC